MSSSISEKEIANFAKDSAHWWDENGPFAILHRLNPVRMQYILDQVAGRFETDLKNLSILDVGCGGGIVCEPLARLGAKVTGIDADENAIKVAKAHAKESGLKIDYRNEPVENIKDKFDVVLALEILEHVNEPPEFIKNCAKALKPGGLMIASTLNRTSKSFALGVVAAEYILRYVPRGTHDWKKFIKPSELSGWMRQHSLKPTDLTGLVFNPATNEFEISEDKLDINYFLTACA